MRETEKLAKEVLEIFFPKAEVHYRDTGTEPNVYDFDIIEEGQVIAAIEVTSTTQEVRKNILSQLEHRECKYRYKPRKAQRPWLVFLHPTETVAKTGVKKLAPKIDDFLAELEGRGVSRFEAGFIDVHEGLKLGIEAARQLSEGEPLILFLLTGSLFNSAQDYITPVVKELADKKNEKFKKTKCHCNCRILLIVVDEQTDYPTWKQMVDYAPSNPPPMLPSEITEVWLIARGRNATFIVWRTKGNTWCTSRIKVKVHRD